MDTFRRNVLWEKIPVMCGDSDITILRTAFECKDDNPAEKKAIPDPLCSPRFMPDDVILMSDNASTNIMPHYLPMLLQPALQHREQMSVWCHRAWSTVNKVDTYIESLLTLWFMPFRPVELSMCSAGGTWCAYVYLVIYEISTPQNPLLSNYDVTNFQKAMWHVSGLFHGKCSRK